ncbi:hypothetical protein DFP72DRAFT_868624 [Ephemerocybe angulata]|uniref:Uncharacterized protein n=1 Tax=Ephemerocybe angulata TaxID=980116 RepID=A0A8H6IK22_9AGAR|nr:hypothetical protein DFP72DRAFT_868624 [Tulosesus angulatus]
MARLHIHFIPPTPLILALALRTMNTSDSHLDQIPLLRRQLRIASLPLLLPRRTSSRDRIPLAVAIDERLLVFVLRFTFTRTRTTPPLQLPSLRFRRRVDRVQAQGVLLHLAYPHDLPQRPHPNPSKPPINLHTPRLLSLPLPTLLPHPLLPHRFLSV